MKRQKLNEPRATGPLGDDLVGGAEDIAAELRMSKRRTYHLLESGALPAFKLGGRWYIRPSTMKKHFAALETLAGTLDKAASSQG